MSLSVDGLLIKRYNTVMSIFGKGKIVAKDENTYTLVFPGAGIKKIDKNFEKLKKV